jgi:DNA-binding CsgD family transcriptional regulator/tetratricopeptide (TPR) repeat protein
MLSIAPAGLLGREAEVSRILAALAVDRVVLVTGEAGIGKTSLVRAAVAAGGRQLLQGAGFATLQAMPYLALRLALGAPVGGDPAAVARRVEAAVADGVLFIDDLQWVDRETRGVLGSLAGRISLAVASRGRSAVEGVPAGMVEVVPLGPLGAEDAAAVARAAAPGLAGPALRRVIQRAGGNPLLLEELARAGRESATIARALAAHVAEASPPARHALGLLAVADRPLRAVPPVLAGADELVVLGLVVRSGDTLAVRHALIADALLAELDDAERRRAHVEVAALVGDDADAARHLAQGGRRAAAVARATAALEGTTDPRTRALLLRVAAEAADGPAADDLRLEAARAALAVDDAPGALDLLGGDTPAEPEACGLHLALRGRAHMLTGRRDDAAVDFARGRALPLDPSGEAASIIATEEALLAANGGDLDGAIAILERAAAEDASGDPVRDTGRRSLLAIVRFMGGAPADLDALRGGVDAAIDQGLGAAAGRARNLCSVILGTTGPAATLAAATEYEERLEAAGLATGVLVGERVQCLTLVGRPAEAVIAADEFLERPEPFSYRGVMLVHRAEALCQLGRLPDADETLRLADPLLADEWGERGEADTTRAHIAFWSGRLRDAISAANAALARPSHYAGNHLLPGLIRGWAQVDLGLRPDPVVAAPSSWATRAGEAEWAALAAMANGRPSTGLFDAAAAAWEGRLHLRALLCRWGAGEAARRHGDPTAVDRLREALDGAEAAGLELLAARVRRSLRLAGARPARRSPAARPARGLLTPRERELLELVAAGRSNAEIGRQMGLGRGTVVRVLSNAMGKLGAASRSQAVTLLADEP